MDFKLYSSRILLVLVSYISLLFVSMAEDLTRKGGNLYGLGFARSHDSRATRELLGTRGLGLRRRRHKDLNKEDWRLLTGDEGLLETWFKRRTKGPIVWKWLHYFDIYETHFRKYRNASRINLLEFGVNAGGSLDLWRAYFGPGLHYYGVDINPACKKFEAIDATIIIGDQTSIASLTQIRDSIPEMDMIIDDGGHSDLMQTNTFKIMHEKLRTSGVYLCEDLGTSFHLQQMQDNDGYSMLDMTKDLIDKNHASLFPIDQRSEVQGYTWDSKGLPFIAAGSSVRQWPVDEFTRSSDNVHIYRSIVVVEKSPYIFEPHTSAMNSYHANMEQYHRHLQKFQNDAIINLFSHGILYPNTIALLREFLGPGLRHCAIESSTGSETAIANLTTSECSDLSIDTSEIHIIVDGYGNTDLHRVSFFRQMFWRLHPHGVYISEGLADNLHKEGLQENSGFSMLDLSKELVDKSQAWLFPSHMLRKAEGYVWNSKGLSYAYPGTSVKVWPVDDFVRMSNNVHVYRGSIVIEKFPRSGQAPKSLKSGTENIGCKSSGGCINSSSRAKAK